MTRINLVPPEELMDQHLFAEFREIKMVPKALARSIKARGKHGALTIVPKEFTLGTGHVSFFYPRGKYLRDRYESIKQELDRRGINYNKDSLFDPDGVMTDPLFDNDYQPTRTALTKVRARIQERYNMKPEWYRHSGREL